MAHVRKDCISFFMTTRCNLDCVYCYLKENKIPNQSIDVEFAKQGIRDYFSKNTSRHIRFFGAGEPTLEFEKIQQIYQFAYEQAGEALLSEIQTNGVFSPSIARWLAKHMDIIWISFDAPQDVHDILRPTAAGKHTAAIIERNIKLLLENGKPGLTVGVRATISPHNLYRQVEMVDYLHSIGVKAIYSDPAFKPVGVQNSVVDTWEIDSKFNMEYAKEFLKAWRHANELGIFYGSVLTINFDEKTDRHCRSCIPSPHLTTDGYVTNCDMGYLGHIFPEFVYGKWHPEQGFIEYFPRVVHSIQLRTVDNLKECQNCEVKYHCAGGCFGEALNETGSLLGVKTTYCDAIRFLAKHMPLNDGLYPYLHP